MLLARIFFFLVVGCSIMNTIRFFTHTHTHTHTRVAAPIFYARSCLSSSLGKHGMQCKTIPKETAITVNKQTNDGSKSLNFGSKPMLHDSGHVTPALALFGVLAAFRVRHVADACAISFSFDQRH
jgi:hypothetical protein